MSPSIRGVDVPLPHGITLQSRTNTATWLAGTQGPSAPRETKTERPRVICLHGFPEGAFIWDHLQLALSGEADVLAPNLRGFGASSAPLDVAAYRVKHLVQDLATLIKAFGGAPLDLLVAHDWGGAVAWALAAARPDLLKHLLIINSPHPATFLRELRDNPAQHVASAYMNFLCSPDAAALLQANDFDRLFGFFTKMGAAPWLDEATQATYRAHWLQGLDGGLNYYRASPLKPALDADSPLHRVQLDAKDVTVTVPTTVLWAEQDVALPLPLIDGLEAFVPNLTIKRIPNATHWVVHEQPALVVNTVRAVLGLASP